MIPAVPAALNATESVPMKVQIYTLQSPEEALAVIEAGADHIGLTPSEHGLPGEIRFATARQIVETVGGRATCVALTIDSDPEEILAMVRAVQPHVLHLCPLKDAMTPDQVAALRAQLPGVQIMQAISVGGPETQAEAIRDAQMFAPVADYLILDTQAPEIPGIGASGKTHDWRISRAIVEAVSTPVILAGGLGPDNVGDAVRAVQPWGVDSLTHTNQPLGEGRFRKDVERVRQFALAARQAAQAR
jgi:phosphoribosylanthranilate isomerase